MKSRQQQRADTRQRIIDAAIEIFSERGFRGGSTRDIAERSGANQGLITYHFQSKEELWKEAANQIFGTMRLALAERMSQALTTDPIGRARDAIRAYVRFASEHPELFRMLVDDGKEQDERMKWLVSTHLKPLYRMFCDGRRALPGGAVEDELPHAFYTFIGASSLIFAVAPECKALTGADPIRQKTIDAHADYLAQVLIPEALPAPRRTSGRS